MRKFLIGCTALFIFSVLCLVNVASADVLSDEPIASEVSSSWGTPPTAASDFTSANSLNLTNLNSYKIIVCATTTSATLSGTGTLNAFTLDERLGVPTRNPARDLTISVTSTSCATDAASTACRCQNFDDVPVGYGRGRLQFKTSGVGTSAGSVTIYYRGYKKIQ